MQKVDTKRAASAALLLAIGRFYFEVINAFQYIVNDEYTLRSLGVDQARLLIHVLVVSGVALGSGAILVGSAATVVGKIAILVLSNAFVWLVDNQTDFERKLVEETLELFE